MKIVFIALLALVPSFTSALRATGIDPENDDIELLKDQILGVNRRTLKYNNHTYEISLFEEEWQTAKYYCKWLGMELLTIETAEENEALVAGFGGQVSETYYMSLNDNYKEGDYHWESTGRKLGPFTNWSSGEPRSDSSYNCAMFNSQTGEWFMSPANCVFDYPYICESIDFDCSTNNQ